MTAVPIYALHDISAELRELDEQLLSETESEREDAIIALRDTLLADLAHNAEELALSIDEDERAADTLNEIAESYRKRAVAAKQRSKTKLAVLEEVMRAQGMLKIPGERATVRIQKNPPSVEYDDGAFDLDLLPDDLVRVKREADAAAIKTALKSGADVPGCRLVQRESLRVVLGK